MKKIFTFSSLKFIRTSRVYMSSNVHRPQVQTLKADVYALLASQLKGDAFQLELS